MQRTDTANPPAVHAAHTHAPELDNRKSKRANRPLKIFSGSIVALLVIVTALVAWYELGHSDRVYRGVSVLGQEVGGLSKADAQAALAAASAGYPAESLTASGSGRNWTLTAADMGVAVDVDKTLDLAMSVGRNGELLDNFRTQLNALFSGTQITPVLQHDAAKVQQIATNIAAEVDQHSVSSKLEKGEDGIVRITPSSSGTLVDQEALSTAIAASVDTVPFAPVEVTTIVEAPEVTEAKLEGAKSQALALTEQPIVLSAGEQSWTMEPTELRQLLTLEHGDGSSVQATLSQDGLTTYLAPVAEEVRVEPVDANVTVGRGVVNLTEEESGSELDVPAAVAAIEQAARGEGDARSVALPLKEVPAAVHTEQVRPLYEKADALVTQGVRLRFRDDGYIMRGTSVTGFLDVAPAEDGPGPLKIVIDEDVLASRISGIATEYVNRQASDARFRMVNGVPTKISNGIEGFKVDIDQTRQNIMQTLDGYQGGDKMQVDMAVAVTQPAIQDADLAGVNTPDMLSYGQTSYVGSSANRAWNVELGTSQINGALIPPGGVFSTVDTIGALTLDAGFKMGYAIVGDGQGGLTTVPAEAGGICQVSTTLFHAVFRGGLHVVERNWHSYWISTYGVAPTGLQGLDATIAPPYKDFRFQNNTGNWLLIKSIAGKGTVKFELWGTNPHWNVAISQPVVTGRIKTSQNPVVEYSSALSKSAGKVMVEHAQDGFNASITRVVTDASGNEIDRWVAKSSYKPAYNRYLIGTGD
jgi:vancomycin resistance protein YoaR